jgi:hypothetical protein
MTQKRNLSSSSSVSSAGVQSHIPSPDQPGDLSTQIEPTELMVTGEEGEKQTKGLIRLPSWHFLGVLLIVMSGGVGFLATSVLLSFNGSSNCTALYVPLASATTRLYCAQIEAEEQTLASYLKAIRMVSGFPEDHPLRPDIDRNIEIWTKDIIELGEVKFQEGKLDEAIAIAEEVPIKSTGRALAEERIEAWRELWREGEEIFDRFKRELNEGDLNRALRTVVQLSYLDNYYWSTTKYQEARNQVQLARKESGELEGAYLAQERGGIENWLKAIEQASRISKESYAYPQAQKLIASVRDDLVDYIQKIVEQNRWQELLTISSRLPNQVNLDNMTVDLKILAQAGLLANKGTTADLEAAIVQIQSIQPSSLVFDQSQKLTGEWQQEIADVSLLEQGKALAADGSIAALERGMAKLKLIPEGNPRYSEAAKLIDQWQNKIEIIEDTPTLDYAKDLAASNRTDGLNEAIAQARSIGQGRALYGEAQSNIRKWQGIIQRREDQPIYDRAVALGNQKRFDEAISVANQIASGRALYADMQQKVSGWRQELNAADKLQSAYQAASRGTVQGLAEAIQLTQQIPSSSTGTRAEGRAAADQWSYGILNEAQRQANTASINQAIATARLIPRGTAAYSAAQIQIEAWERVIRPIDSGITLSNP